MSVDRAAWPFVLGTLAPALALALARRPRSALALGAVSAFMLFFFRDPERTPPAGTSLVLSPADGRVMVAGAAGPEAPAGDWLQVSIFLSPMDVHINRAPVGGVVRRVEYRPGRFLAAYKPESAHLNERNEIWIDTGAHTVVARQIVGVLARRVVCRVTAGSTVEAGQRVGLMKFGSRMDVFVPLGTRLTVAAGDRVVAGESIIAHLPPSDR
ncbi:MAG: phosphatidylserine decarboxylase [Vicinamibacterales bacterium]